SLTVGSGRPHKTLDEWSPERGIWDESARARGAFQRVSTRHSATPPSHPWAPSPLLSAVRHTLHWPRPPPIPASLRPSPTPAAPPPTGARTNPVVLATAASPTR